MGYALSPIGKPVYSTTPTQTRADFQAAVDFAAEVGSVLRGTSSERTSLTTAEWPVGWLFSETDTGRLYLRTAAETTGVLVGGKGLPHFAYKRMDPYEFDTVLSAITYAETPFEGELMGFTTNNRRVFTCDIAGVYIVAAVAAAVSGAGITETYTNLQIQRNDVTLAAGNSQSIANATWFTSPTATASATVRFERGDTLKIAIQSGAKVAGAAGANCAMFVDYLHP